ncbi:MAG: DNA polymerase III subunit alpha, partial [Actinobacteria bacterium]|nr:DNA polymerase III subunit alpha [Actinomycetota bacterium]
LVFDDVKVPIPDVEFDKSKRLAFEKEMLGLYVSDHPLMGVEAALSRHVDATINDLRDLRESEVRVVGGVITSLSRKYTKRGELMATFVLEDLQSAIEVWVFPKTMLDVGHLLADDAVVCVKGRIDNRDDQPKLVCLELKRPDLTTDAGPPLRISLPITQLTDATVNRLKRLLKEHQGPSPVFLHVGEKVLRLAEDFAVDASNGLVGELRVLLGANCILG